MGQLIRLSDHFANWKQVFSHDGENATVQVYVNDATGEVEIVQMNDEGESWRTCLSTVDSVALVESLKKAHAKIGTK